jgi:hypothetical protein
MTNFHRETTLAQVKLHWGIFVPVVLFVTAPILVFLPYLFIFHRLIDLLRPIGLPVNPSFDLIWLIGLVPYCFVVAGLFLLTWFSYSKSEITLTDRRLVFRTGFLSKSSGDLPLENIESIFVSESLLGRLCGYGNLTITTLGGNRFLLWYIGSPQGFHSTLQSAVSNAKSSGSMAQPPQPSPPDDDSRYRPKG